MPELYPYQRDGVRFLAGNRRAILGDQMGLGKTAQAIVAAAFLNANRVADGGQPLRTLVVCPASLRENWRREWEVWGTGVPEPRIISYAKMGMAKHRNTLDSNSVDVLIGDEIHYCKSPSANRTKATLGFGRMVISNGGTFWGLSGTVMPNDPRELWPLFKYIWPEYPKAWDITTAFKWMDRFCVWADSDFGHRVWGTTPAAKNDLGRALRRIMLRRTLDDVGFELPPLRYHVQRLDKDPKLAAQLAEEYGTVPEAIDSIHLATLRRLLGVYKAKPVAKILRDELTADTSMALVVMFHHHDVGDALLQELNRPEHRAVKFDGRDSQEKRQTAIDMFQSGQARVIIVQQQAGGTGINLQRGNEIVLVEPAWSPAENEQAIKRIHRIGQDRPCRARVFAVPDSLDEQLMGVLRRKMEMGEAVGVR